MVDVMVVVDVTAYNRRHKIFVQFCRDGVPIIIDTLHLSEDAIGSFLHRSEDNCVLHMLEDASWESVLHLLEDNLVLHISEDTRCPSCEQCGSSLLTRAMSKKTIVDVLYAEDYDFEREKI